jgi:hypothetical protein
VGDRLHRSQPSQARPMADSVRSAVASGLGARRRDRKGLASTMTPSISCQTVPPGLVGQAPRGYSPALPIIMWDGAAP